MKTLTLSTNMHCGQCVAKLAKVLDHAPGVRHWKADVHLPQKPVTVYGDISESQLTSLIEQAGFLVNGPETAAGKMQQTASPQNEKKQFWSDANVWKRASLNTLNCLIGCTIGDFAMLIFLQTYYPHTTRWAQMLLATVMGLITSIALETTLLRFREKFAWVAALRTALSMSALSMVAMETIMNATDFMIMGGKGQLGSPLYWLAFIPAAVAGFLTPLPYNYYRLKKHNRACH